MFATYGVMLLNGARPYVDFWDVHPPLVFAYWALVQALTGTDWPRQCVPVPYIVPQSCTGLVAHGIDLLLTVAAALVVAGIARRCGSSIAMAAVAAVLVIGFANQVMLSQEGSNPSKLTLLPSTLAVLAYLSCLDARRAWRGAVVAGLAATFAGMAKQPALLTLAVLLAHALWRRDRTIIAGLLAGVGATLAFVCVTLAAIGSLGAFVEQAWVYNVERALLYGYFQRPVKPPIIGLDRVLTESAGVLAILAIVGAMLVARTPVPPGQRIVIWWALANTLAVTVFREFVYIVPSLAILAAFGFVQLWRWLGAFRVQKVVIGPYVLLAVCAASLLATTSFQRVQLARARFERGPDGGLSQTEALGQILRRDLPSGALFVYGNGAEIYALSGRMPATAYVNAEALRMTAPDAERTRAKLVATLEKSPPPVIVLAPHSDEAELNLADYPTMRMFIQTCYTRHPYSTSSESTWAILARIPACSPV